MMFPCYRTMCLYNRIHFRISINLIKDSPYIKTYSHYSCIVNPKNNILKASEVRATAISKNRHNRFFSSHSTLQSLIITQTEVFRILSESTPVRYAQSYLINLYELTGLPWWANIIFCTILARTFITLPFTVYLHYILSKLDNLKGELPQIAEALKQETAVAIKMFNWDEKTAKYHFKRSMKKQWNNLIIRDNCHPFKGTLVVWVQVPLWISLSVAYRNLVYMLPHQDMKTQFIYSKLVEEGIAWIPDLTMPDHFILPLLLGTINLMIIEIEVLRRTSAPTKMQKFFVNLFRGFSLIMIPIASSVPSCIVLYWTTSSVCGLVQKLFLMSPRMRRLCRIPKTANEIEKPYSHLYSAIKTKYGNLLK